MIGALPSPFVTLSPPLGCRAVEGQCSIWVRGKRGACVFILSVKSGMGCVGAVGF